MGKRQPCQGHQETSWENGSPAKGTRRHHGKTAALPRYSDIPPPSEVCYTLTLMNQPSKNWL
jgi:hypothetical protein